MYGTCDPDDSVGLQFPFVNNLVAWYEEVPQIIERNLLAVPAGDVLPFFLDLGVYEF
jgi:hypothetical protein